MCLFGCLGVKISDVRGGGGEGGFGRHSDNPGQTGEGGSENHDFGRTSFVNAPLVRKVVTIRVTLAGSAVSGTQYEPILNTMSNIMGIYARYK